MLKTSTAILRMECIRIYLSFNLSQQERLRYLTRGQLMTWTHPWSSKELMDLKFNSRCTTLRHSTNHSSFKCWPIKITFQFWWHTSCDLTAVFWRSSRLSCSVKAFRRLSSPQRMRGWLWSSTSTLLALSTSTIKVKAHGSSLVRSS